MKKNIPPDTGDALSPQSPAIVSAQAPKDAIVVSDADIKAVLKLAADTEADDPRQHDQGHRHGRLTSWASPSSIEARCVQPRAPAAAPAPAAAANTQPACGQQRAGATGPGGIYHDSTAETYVRHVGQRDDDYRRHDRQRPAISGRQRSDHDPQRPVVQRDDGRGTAAGRSTVGDIIVIPEGVPHGFHRDPGSRDVSQRAAGSGRRSSRRDT